MSDNEKKLRTLKDIERFITNQDLGDPFSNDYRCKWLVVEDDLRSCAREWIKKIDTQQYEESNPKKWEVCEVDGLEINCGEYTCDNVVNWIKHFFNLEDE